MRKVFFILKLTKKNVFHANSVSRFVILGKRQMIPRQRQGEKSKILRTFLSIDEIRKGC
jgi:hypothetical protein